MVYRTVGLKNVLDNAEKINIKYNVHYTSSVELLYAMLITPKCYASEFLNKFGVTKEAYHVYLRSMLMPNFPKGYTIEASSVIYNADKIAIEFGYNYVSSEHLLYSLLTMEECRAFVILNGLGVNIDGLRAYTKQKIIERCEKEQAEKQTRETEEPKSVEKDANPLKGLGYSLIERAKSGDIDPVIGRDDEIERIIQTLSRKTKNNPLLIGEAGVGKSAVVEGLAIKMAKGEVPDTLKGKTIFALDVGGLVSGTRYRGDFEKKLKDAIDYAVSKKNIIFFIDEIHNIVGAGSSSDSPLDIAEIFKPLLSRGEISVIGATTINEYRKYIEKDSALERRFQTILVNEPSIEDTITILNGLRSVFESHHKVRITDQAIETAVKLSNRYVTDRKLPDKAIDLIDEACSKKKLNSKKQPKILIELQQEHDKMIANRDYALHHNDLDSAKFYDTKATSIKEKLDKEKAKILLERAKTESTVTDEDVKVLLSEWTKIPLNSLTEKESVRLGHLEDELVKQVVGQEKAIEVVSKAVRRSFAGLKDPDRPIGSFLFVGPTGVGKTQLAKAIATEVFQDKDALISFDMSEYTDKVSLNKLIGSAPGYVGFEEEGLLTEKVRRKPYSVVLFDEIEKAHSDIFDLLLQVLDEGRLTDNKGRVVNFKSTIIILTSNAGYHISDKKSLGFGADNTENNVKESLKHIFKPEFLGRLDDIVVFNNLTENDFYDIADILANSLIKRMREEGYILTIDNSAMDIIVKNSYTKNDGARVLKKEISTSIEDILSDAIIDGSIKRGDKVLVYGENGIINYKRN